MVEYRGLETGLGEEPGLGLHTGLGLHQAVETGLGVQQVVEWAAVDTSSGLLRQALPSRASSQTCARSEAG